MFSASSTQTVYPQLVVNQRLVGRDVQDKGKGESLGPAVTSVVHLSIYGTTHAVSAIMKQSINLQ